MRDKKFKDIQSVLDSLLNNYGIKNYVYYDRLIREWKNIVGNTLAKQCYPTKIENGVLFLKTKNSVWKNELFLRRFELIDLISNNYYKNIVKKIQFI